MDEFNLELVGTLDQQKTVNNLKSDLKDIEKKIDNLELEVKLSPKSLTAIGKQLNLRTNVSDIEINSNAVTKMARRAGQKLGQELNQSVQDVLSLDDEIDAQVERIMDLYSIMGQKGSKAFKEIKQSILDYRKELEEASRTSTNSDDPLDIFANAADINKVTSAIAKHIKFTNDAKEAYANLAKYIKIINDDHHVKLPQSIKDEFGDDFSSMQKILGKGFSLKGDWPFEEFIEELNGDLGNLIDTSKGVEFAFEDLVKKLSLGRGKNTLSGEELFETGILNRKSLLKEITDSISAISLAEERMAQQSTTTTNTVVKNEKKKQSAYKGTKKVLDNLKDDDSLGKQGLAPTFWDASNDSAKEVKNQFKELLKDEKAVITLTETLNSTGELTNFVVNIKRATGVVESFKYALEELSEEEMDEFVEPRFKLQNSTIGDAGAIRQIQKVEKTFSDYTARISKFKSTNQGILSGLTTPLEAFEKSLASLKSGGSTIGEVIKNFNTLESEAAKISVNLNNTTSSFNKIQNAINNIAKGEEVIKGLSAQFKGLKTQPQEVASELRKVSSLLRSVKKIESTEGRGEKWSKKYAEFSSALSALQAKLNTLAKQDKFSVSEQILNTEDLDKQGKLYALKLNNTIEKTLKEIEPKLRKAGYVEFEIKGTEKANGQIKSLVVNATDAYGVIKKLRFETAKLQKNGKAQTGLVQLDEVKYLGKLSKNVEKVRTRFNDLKNQWETQGVLVGTFKEKVEELGRTLDSVNSKKGLASIETSISEMRDFAEIQKKLNSDEYGYKVDKLEADFIKYGLSVEEAKEKVQELREILSSMTNGDSIDIVSDFEKFETKLKDVNVELSKTRLSYDKFSQPASDTAITKTLIKIQDLLANNTRATKEARTQWQQYANLLSSGTTITVKRLNEINLSLEKTKSDMRILHKLGKSVIDQLKDAGESFTQWVSVSSAIMALVDKVKSSVVELKELDNILTEISKTADLTSQALINLGDNSFEAASKYGKTASDYLTGVQEMYRAGYDNATALAEVSIQAQAAGDMTADVANDYLIATDAAYGLMGSAEKLTAVLDSQNFITNNAAVSMNDMASATSEAASIAAQYGVQVDELSSLIAVAVSKTRESGSEAGNALKSIFVNLQDTTSKPVTDVFESLDISMTKIVNGAETLKTPIELLKELSEVFVSLEEGSTLRANILNDIGGKYHANTLASILGDWASFEKMMGLYANGAGSSMVEAMKSANNLQGSLNRLRNTGTDIIGNIISAEELTMLVNGLNELLTLLNKLTDAAGSWGTIGIGAGLIMGTQNAGNCMRVHTVQYHLLF